MIRQFCWCRWTGTRLTGLSLSFCSLDLLCVSICMGSKVAYRWLRVLIIKHFTIFPMRQRAHARNWMSNSVCTMRYVRAYTYTAQYLHLNCHLFGFFPGLVIFTGSCQCERVSLFGPRHMELLFRAASSQTFFSALSPSDSSSVLISETWSHSSPLFCLIWRVTFRYFMSKLV